MKWIRNGGIGDSDPGDGSGTIAARNCGRLLSVSSRERHV